MTDCARPDVSDRLLMALAPEEFPEDAHEIEEHLKHCPECRNELDALRTIHKIIGDHRHELSDVFEPCPTAESLVEFALGEQTSRTIEDHISFCPNCAEQVSLVAALYKDSPDEATQVVQDARPLIRKVVSKELGLKDESDPPPAEPLWHRFIQSFHVPSLALGAAAAVICFLIVAPYQSKEPGFRPALSNVTWATSTSVTRKDSSGLPATQAPPLKKVAILILLTPDLRLPDKDIDKMYSEIDLAARLGSQYQFLSPHEMKRVLADRSGLDAQSISEVASEKSGANYVLLFEITQSKSGYDLNGRLFRKGQKQEFSGIFQTGLSLPTIPSKINSIGKELLLDAES
ncbi:MAG: anti-sigma factor family protein [Desulfomonilaceae bacterium]